MKVLIVKMSSMGDIIHTLPALTDAIKAYPDIEFDWVVEEGFAEIPAWHPAVKKIIPIAWRRWRKQLRSSWHSGELTHFWQNLREKTYDKVIDAQGLIKSAVITRAAQGVRIGYDRQSIREPLACLAYQKKYKIDKDQHAITRIRLLFANALGYKIDLNTIHYDLKIPAFNQQRFNVPEKYLVFIPNTSASTKHWPVEYWRNLIKSCAQENISVVVPGGYAHERPLINQITLGFSNAIILDKTSLQEMAGILKLSCGIVSVDTGLSHLAAALDKKTIVLYGPTDPKKIGTQGIDQIHLSAFPENLSNIPSDLVWQKIMPWLTTNGN